jgi:hypothetical protein
MNLNRTWTGSAVNAQTVERSIDELPKSLQAEHAELVAAVADIEGNTVPRPSGAPSFEALKRQHGYPGAGSLLRETGLRDTELLVNGSSIDFDKIAAKILTKAGEVTNPQILESYAELFMRLAKILRSNVEAVNAERAQRTAFDIYRDQLQTAKAGLQSFNDRVAGMSDHEIQTIKHAEELQQLRDEYEQRFKVLEAKACE